MSLKKEAITLLKQLVAIPAFSGEESRRTAVLEDFFRKKGIPFTRKNNNILARAAHWSNLKPTLLLNSHIDTVRPVHGWKRDPFKPVVESGKLYGLGSNDAGGALVSLIAVFLHFYEQTDRPFNLILAATGEEENSGKNGIASILDDLGNIDLGIVGEPTQMNMAIAEKGLMVVDGCAVGRAGHAARDEGQNAIYIALEDIAWIQNHDFPKSSKHLGKVKMTVTQISAGTQHNVVPDQCHFVVDVRSNEAYSNREIFEIMRQNCRSDLKARSFRLNASGIDPEHPVVRRARALNLHLFGSATLSDQALLHFPTVKIGPGDSARSHTADEFIRISEIEQGIDCYIQLLEGLKL
ncbi:MAG: M20/M25/M40 family metallo-hydrolase [Bacteroidetes bacterium]|nr:MAG: M20/M25/M40 family metallo-hydrolase [Bacteroidota bacterium]